MFVEQWLSNNLKHDRHATFIKWFEIERFLRSKQCDNHVILQKLQECVSKDDMIEILSLGIKQCFDKYNPNNPFIDNICHGFNEIHQLSPKNDFKQRSMETNKTGNRQNNGKTSKYHHCAKTFGIQSLHCKILQFLNIKALSICSCINIDWLYKCYDPRSVYYFNIKHCFLRSNDTEYGNPFERLWRLNNIADKYQYRYHNRRSCDNDTISIGNDELNDLPSNQLIIRNILRFKYANQVWLYKWDQNNKIFNSIFNNLIFFNKIKHLSLMYNQINQPNDMAIETNYARVMGWSLTLPQKQHQISRFIEKMLIFARYDARRGLVAAHNNNNVNNSNRNLNDDANKSVSRTKWDNLLNIIFENNCHLFESLIIDRQTMNLSFWNIAPKIENLNNLKALSLINYDTIIVNVIETWDHNQSYYPNMQRVIKSDYNYKDTQCHFNHNSNIMARANIINDILPSMSQKLNNLESLTFIFSNSNVLNFKDYLKASILSVISKNIQNDNNNNNNKNEDKIAMDTRPCNLKHLKIDIAKDEFKDSSLTFNFPNTMESVSISFKHAIDESDFMDPSKWTNPNERQIYSRLYKEANTVKWTNEEIGNIAKLLFNDNGAIITKQLSINVTDIANVLAPFLKCLNFNNVNDYGSKNNKKKHRDIKRLEFLDIYKATFEDNTNDILNVLTQLLIFENANQDTSKKTRKKLKMKIDILHQTHCKEYKENNQLQVSCDVIDLTQTADEKEIVLLSPDTDDDHDAYDSDGDNHIVIASKQEKLQLCALKNQLPLTNITQICNILQQLNKHDIKIEFEYKPFDCSAVNDTVTRIFNEDNFVQNEAIKWNNFITQMIKKLDFVCFNHKDVTSPRFGPCYRLFEQSPDRWTQLVLEDEYPIQYKSKRFEKISIYTQDCTSSAKAFVIKTHLNGVME